MNPDRIYRQYRDEALAQQITAAEYSTFVAMPFADRYSYRSKEVYRNVIQAAADCANQKGSTQRKFALPKRVDDGSGTAIVITEEIVVRILEAHLFLADLTFENPGVVLETGIAMGLKSNQQIILITQGDLKDLHFDLRNNNVLTYNHPSSVEQIAVALIAGANAFESDCKFYIESVSESLSADATFFLKQYGGRQQEKPGREVRLHRGDARQIYGDHNMAEIRYENATRELLSRRLMRTDYRVRADAKNDAYGMQATDLGWAVIEYMWKELRRTLPQNT
jgi:hypothetical protein